MKRAIPTLLAGVAVIASAAYADTWAAPSEKDVFSPSGQFRVHMTPGKGKVGSTGSEPAPKPEWATATLYSERGAGNSKKLSAFSLMNPVAPLSMLLTNEGRLLTVDNHAEVGYGKVVVLYDPNGSILKAYSLDDLFTVRERQRFVHSVSSIWWHHALPSLDKAAQRSLLVATAIQDVTLEINLETGECLVHRP
jgi:hypothetical protein